MNKTDLMLGKAIEILKNTDTKEKEKPERKELSSEQIDRVVDFKKFESEIGKIRSDYIDGKITKKEVYKLVKSVGEKLLNIQEENPSKSQKVKSLRGILEQALEQV